MVRCMLCDKQVPKAFWPEVARWTVHVLNRSPTLVLKDKTLEEMWSGVKPKVDYFRVFRCLAHVHVPDQKRRKLDDKSLQCVLLEVSHESKAYRLFDLAIRRIIVSRDVSFEEDKDWNWGRTIEKVKLDILVWENSVEGEEAFSQSEEEVVEGIEAMVTDQEAEATTPTSIESSNEVAPIQAETRIRRAPPYLQDYVTGEGLSENADVNNLAMFISHEDPGSFEEAKRDVKWIRAMDLEIEAIEKNKTWQLTTLLNGAKKIGVKWVFKTKLNEKGEIDKCKARLVAKGYAQR